GVFAPAVLHDFERAVLARRDLEEQRTRAGKVTQHELSFPVCASQRSGVAIDAKNRTGNLVPRLTENQAPRRLALRALHLHVPETGNRRHAGRVERRGGEALRLKGIRTPAGADVLALETPILERRLEPGSVLWIA